MHKSQGRGSVFDFLHLIQQLLVPIKSWALTCKLFSYSCDLMSIDVMGYRVETQSLCMNTLMGQHWKALWQPFWSFHVYCFQSFLSLHSASYSQHSSALISIGNNIQLLLCVWMCVCVVAGVYMCVMWIHVCPCIWRCKVEVGIFFYPSLLFILNQGHSLEYKSLPS